MSIARALAEYLGQRSAARFDWSSWHCVLFGAEWIRKVEGRDVLPDLRGVSSPLTARAAVRAAGGLAAGVTRQLGREPIDPRQAQVGDLLLAQTAGPCGAALGICNGRDGVFLTEAGLISVPAAQAAHAWRVVPA